VRCIEIKLCHFNTNSDHNPNTNPNITLILSKLAYLVLIPDLSVDLNEPCPEDFTHYKADALGNRVVNM